MSPVWTITSAGVASRRSRTAVWPGPGTPESPNTSIVRGALGSSAWNTDSVPSGTPSAFGTYAYLPPGTSPSTAMAHTVPVSPAMVAAGPSSARIVSEHALATSVFQATVTECVVRSCRYGPRVSIAALAGAAATRAASSGAASAAPRASEHHDVRRRAKGHRISASRCARTSASTRVLESAAAHWAEMLPRLPACEATLAAAFRVLAAFAMRALVVFAPALWIRPQARAKRPRTPGGSVWPWHVGGSRPPVQRHVTPAGPSRCWLTQPSSGSQVSTVQASPSLHPTWSPPTQPPCWHVSFCMQVLPSSQGVPSGAERSCGQLSEVPSQVSAASQDPADGRQTPLRFRSDGQAALSPVQASATSQSPAAGRHSNVAGLKVSTGHPLLVPVQSSASSHGPAAGRHSNVAGSKASAGQVGLDPVQSSVTSQGPVAGRHTVVAGSSWQLEEQQSPSSRFPSSHCSSGAGTPALQS